MAADVAKLLGYSKALLAVQTHCKGAVKRSLLTAGGPQMVTMIPERDVYRLIMRSKLPSAEAFEEWVVGTVLPSLRKHGGYVVGQEKVATGEVSPMELMANAVMVAQSVLAEAQAARIAAEARVVEQDVAIEEMTPKAALVDHHFAGARLTTSDRSGHFMAARSGGAHAMRSYPVGAPGSSLPRGVGSPGAPASSN